MTILSPDQRNYYYLLAAERVGIHKPILAALYQVHSSPTLADEETGLGISPANRVSPDQVNTLPEQVQYAANVIRSLTDSLIVQGQQGTDLWLLEQGRYSDEFLQNVARGYVPPAGQPFMARLEPSNFESLKQAYLADLAADFRSENLPQNLAYLDKALLTLVDRLPEYYTGLPHQRDALLEAVRIWRKLDTQDATIASLVPTDQVTSAREDASKLDIPLKQFMGRVSGNYSGYPHQREALLRLTQLWRQLRTREEAIASLKKNASPQENLDIIDPALVAFIERVPKFYQGQGSQRNALTEGFRLWNQFDSRATVLSHLGINPDILQASTTDPTAMQKLAAELDQELISFVGKIPKDYKEDDNQREALIRLVQLWRDLPTRNQAVQSLLEDQKRMNEARRQAQEAPPKPTPVVIPKRPERWTPYNIQLSAPIIPDGSFTWAEATHGGTRMPPNQATVDAMVRIAKLAQRARDRIGRPFIVTSWYRPPYVNRAVGGAKYSRHLVGDAMDFVCEGLSGNQIYWSLEPWWPGGLGRYSRFPNLCHIDARSYRARWLH
ncbi:MAG: D-Ala-D-Ala carboxypeptidase family metallohydrolase [Coleofasciculus sp. G3-WIS-01]|uniref:D-Ala-D-Ala carboxypeptidase family metallohydrolase n=1 Tax=Coleofasciculus sp. G3-WIS-01 TaxID=3069528 RepID=UPI0032FA6C35